MPHSQQSFSLLCFPQHPGCPRLEINGTIALQANTLTLDYRLNGELSALNLPASNHPPVNHLPTRRDGLWQHTCFELFIATPGQLGYHEFNLSPSGDWNCYRFSDYRQHMQTETALATLPFRVTRGPGQLRLQLTLELATLLPAYSPLDIGITAVIQQADSLSYWALLHPAEQADFHHRDGFALRLAPA